MAVKYVTYGRNRVKVSRRWHAVLTEADRQKVRFTINSGHRTMAEQQRLYDQNMIRPGVPKPGRPLTAVPNRNAPHIRIGRADHALDVDSLDGGEQRLQDWLDENDVATSNPVAGEAWHMEANARDLERFARRIQRRNARQRKAKVKPKPRPKRPEPRPKSQDAALAQRLKAKGVPRFGLEIIEEARRTKVPLSWALALIEQETGFRNIFGADQSSRQLTELHHKPVTAERVKKLLRHVAAGGHSNGVGPAQLTSVDYIKQADREGGAHKPRINIRVGLQVLKAKTGGNYAGKAWRYNGSPLYQGQIHDKQRRWAQVLDRLGG